MSYLIMLDDDRPADARIDLIGQSVILHSRGGSTGGRPARNEGQAGALIAICRRAQAGEPVIERVLIDSTVARKLPEADRVLLSRADIEALNGDELARAIRTRLRRFGQAEGTIGGNSTKQVRLDFGLAPASIINLLGLQEGEFASADISWPAIERLSAALLRQVQPIHVLYAVDRLLAGEDAPDFSPSRDYDVLTPSGERLAPKKVFGLAIELGLGIKTLPAHFSAGWGQPCFDIIQQAGLAIVEKAAASRLSGGHYVPPPPDPDETKWAEGDPRFAEHLRMERRRSRRAVAAKRARVREFNQGRLACENPSCIADWYAIFPPAIAEAVFEVHHTIPVSAMQPDHQTSLDDLRCLCAACHRAEHQRLRLESLP